MVLSNYFQNSTKVERVLGVVSIILMLIFYWTSGHESNPGEYVYKAEWFLITITLFFTGSLFLYNILLAVGKKITALGRISLASFVILVLAIFLLSDTITPHEHPLIYGVIGIISFFSIILINIIIVFDELNLMNQLNNSC